jgi:hypothetical protein
VGNPRTVTEKIHMFNDEVRPGEGPRKDGANVRIATFDIKDFFTCVPRDQLLDDVRNGINEVRNSDPRMRYF